MRGRAIKLSRPRRLVNDLMRFSIGIPRVTVQRRMNIARLLEARASLAARPSWTAIFLKAYGLLAMETPELRRAFVRLPWPQLYEYPESVGSVAYERDWEGEPAVLLSRIKGPEHRSLKQLDAACAFAKEIGCKKATVVAGDDVEGATPEAMHKDVIAALKRAAPIAEKNDLMLILEPMNVRVDHKGHCLFGSEAAVKICRAVASSHVKINWDLYHMQISEGDLCRRLRSRGYDVRLVPSVEAIHDARRASHRSLRHLRWHLASLARFLLTR